MNPGWTSFSNLNLPSLKFEIPVARQSLPKPWLSPETIKATQNLGAPKTSFFQSKTGQALKNAGVSAVSSILSDKFTQQLNLFGDSEVGQTLGGIFGQGINTAVNTMGNNLMKGVSLTEGLGKNVGSSLAGAGAGIAANYIGQGINALGGDSMLSRGIGQGIATGLGQVGGETLSNLVAGKGAVLPLSRNRPA